MRYYEIIQEFVTDTPAFKRWFGDSKIVDAYGRPLRMYHGSKHSHITAFEVGYNSLGNKDFEGNHKVISFTTDPEFASSYAGEPVDSNVSKKPTVYPVYIRSINPGDFRNPEHVEKVIKWYVDLHEKFFERVKISHPHVWTPERIEEERAKELRFVKLHVPRGSWMYWEKPDMWKHYGWDGAWCREEPNHPLAHVLNFAVADGRQVKSATGNKNFDPENPTLTETMI